MTRRAVIAGGGLAGIAAAVRLADAGWRPIVLETRKRLGGRATSLVDPRTERVIDNCQHVLLGCCTNLLDLYDRLDVAGDITWHRRLFWTDGGGRVDEMAAGWMPAPFHLSPSLMRMKLFDRAAVMAIARAMWRLIRLGSKGRYAWRDRTFREFLDECRQPESVIERFWHPIVVGACNLPVDRVSAEVAMQVFQEGFLANRWSYTMGIPEVPLGALYDPAVELIESHGGEVRTGVSARAIAFAGGRVSGVVTDDGLVDGAAVISAVPADRLDRLVSDTMREADPRLTRLAGLETSPILGVHLLFDTPIMDLPHLTLVEHDVHWLFNKGTDADGCQHVHAVVSAADDWMDLDEDAIVERVMADIHSVLPGAKGLQPIESRSIKERHATFAAVPGFDACRPAAAAGSVGLGGGGIRNLYLAGDWCDTGWPATMESAVRSGYLAAAACTGEGGLVADVPPGLLAAILGLRPA